MKIILVLSLIILVIVLPGKSFAHHDEQNGHVDALIHLDPNDNPIAGARTPVHIKIEDSQKKFNIEKCNCEVIIIQNEKKLTSKKEFDKSNLYDISFNYVFPSVGRYEVKLIANPVQQNNFDPFEVSFYIKIDKEIKGIDRFIYNLSDFRGQILFIIVAFTFALFIIFNRLAEKDPSNL